MNNSWEADVVGYGVCINELDVNSIERIEALLDYAPITRKRIKETFAENGIITPTLDDYDEYDDGETFCGFAGILQDVILEIKDILNEFISVITDSEIRIGTQVVKRRK